jgi:putative acetyltransferase
VFHIRRAVVEDIPSIWSVRTHAIQVGCRSHYTRQDAERWAAVPIPPEFSKVIAETDFYVCVRDSSIVGFGFLNQSTAEVGGMFVDPTVHRLGVGQSILTVLEDAAMKARLPRLQLVSTLNAEAFYAKAGFQSRGPSVWHHPIGFDLPCVNMWKDLESDPL